MDENQKVLRKKIKESQFVVMERFIRDHSCSVCLFCGSEKNITKEHVIPQWAFESKTEQTLVNKTNEQSQSYMHLTVPACWHCNSVLLSSLEDYLRRLFSETEIKDFSNENVDYIIWWLQSIGYKLQVMDLRKKFLRHKAAPYIPYLADIPVAMLRGAMNITPSQTFNMVRKARRELFSKRKTSKRNALVMFKTKNKSFYFFHKVDDFIYIELPQVKKAFFLFFNKEFVNINTAKDECWEIIKKVYED